MRRRLRPVLLLALAAILPAREPARAQTLDEPRELLRTYGAIAARYREGHADAAAELLALWPLRVRTLPELMGQAVRQPALLEREVWTPGLLRAAAMLHTDIAFQARAKDDQSTFQQHLGAADRVLQVAEPREPSSDFRPRWHVAVGLELLDGADIEAARAFLTRSCELLPTQARVRLACGIVVTTYASRLKTTPPNLEQSYIQRGGRRSELAEYDLFDSGVPQRIQSAQMETLPLNVMLALDVSSSTEGRPLHDLQDAARAVVSSLRAEDRMALLTFSEHVELRAPWTENAARLTRAIDGTFSAGGTALRDAIFCALGLREGISGRTLLMVFSDGYDTASWLTVRDIVDAAERTDVSIHIVQTIGIPDRRDDELRRQLLAQPQLNEAHLLPVLARETGGAAMSVSDSGQARAAFLKILDDFRAGYVLTYTPEGVPNAGWHPIQVRLKGARGDVHARRGYSKP